MCLTTKSDTPLSSPEDISDASLDASISESAAESASVDESPPQDSELKMTSISGAPETNFVVQATRKLY